MSDFIQVITTAPSEAEARGIAAALVESRLAACVQVIGPIQSTYRWEGAIESAREWQCAAKTRRDLFAEVEQAIRARHSYKVPEILALPVDAGNSDYLNWLAAELRPDSEAPPAESV